MENKFLVSTSPHLRTRDLTPRIMWFVFLSLIPSGIAGTVIFGLAALKIIVISVLTCILTEACIQKLLHKKITVGDGSAALTGLLLAYNLSSKVPFWIPLVGAVFAIAIVKQAFGGLGMNIFNPALAGRAFLMASWPKYMTDFAKPFSVDAVSSATPLMMLDEGKAQSFAELGLNYWDLFLGRRGGCIGEVCILALLIGAAFLLWKKYIRWYTPAGFVLSLGFLSWTFAGKGLFHGDFIFSILSGGLILGAFFMATDYVTTPLTGTGQLIFGASCGFITFIIRKYGGYPEGVSYSILMMNAVTPLIDRYVKPKIYGTR